MYEQKSVSTSIRKVVSGIVLTKAFDNVIIGFIVLNCIFMAMEDPTADPDIERDTLQHDVLPLVELIFAIIFTGELVAKWVVYGVVVTRRCHSVCTLLTYVAHRATYQITGTSVTLSLWE